MNRPAMAIMAITGLMLSAGSSSAADSGIQSSLLIEGWHHRVWSIYPVEKIKPEDALPKIPKAEAIEISAARGESEPFILVLRGDIPLRDIKIDFEDLASDPASGQPAAKLPKTSFSFRRAAYIHVDEPSGTRIKQPMPYPTGTGYFPDPLMAGPAEMRPNHNLLLWVTARISRDALPGLYRGHLVLTFRREGWMAAGAATTHRIPLSVRVRTFALPQVSPLLNTGFFAPSSLTRERRDPQWLDGFYRDFVVHRHTPQPVLPSPILKVEKDGTLSIDSTEWEKVVATFVEQYKVPHLFLPVWGTHPEPAQLQGIYFLWHFPAVTKQRWFNTFIADESRDLTPQFKQQFGAYLRHMHAVLQRRGWLDRFFITTMDEPYTYHTADRQKDIPENNYQVIRNFVAMVRDNAPGLRTFCTADPAPGLIGHIDHWCLRNLKYAAAARERATKHNEVFTYCDNYRTFLDYPAVSARSLGWLAWEMGARGWLTYETMAGFKTAWEGPVFAYPMFSGATVWGMGQYFYPEPASAGIIPSIRWELMLEGCEDYEYLWLLREAVEKLPPEKRDSERARSARTLLETAAAQVVGGAGDAETDSGAREPNATSNLVPHRLREQLGNLIEQLGQ